MTMSASMWSRFRVAETRAGPSSDLYGFVREVPRIVPPRVSNPRVVSIDSGMLPPSITPRHPWRYPTNVCP